MVAASNGEYSIASVGLLWLPAEYGSCRLRILISPVMRAKSMINEILILFFFLPDTFCDC